MSIYDFAMQMEKDGEAYYRKLAGRAENTGLRRILEMLAEDEVTHFKILQEMKDTHSGVLTPTSILIDAKNVFALLREEKNWKAISADQVVLYRKAQEIEEKSRAFYADKAAAAINLQEKEILFKIAAEEKRHYFLLEEIIQFVSRPQTWLENAEFFHLDEY